MATWNLAAPWKWIRTFMSVRGPEGTAKPRWLVCLEVAKLVLDIVAIPTAAYWAYTRFKEDDLPALERRADVDGELNWYGRSATACVVEYKLKFENIGKKPIDVSRIRIRAWYVRHSADAAADGKISYVDTLASIDEPHPDIDIKPTRLVAHYGPGEKDKEGLSFIVPRAPGKRVVFKADIWAQEQSNNAEPTWYDWRHDLVCPDDADAPASQAAASSPRP